VPHDTRRAALAAFALVLVLRAAALASLLATPLASWHLWTETDEHAYVDWSSRLAAGNWMDVPAYRAFFNWQKAYGPEETWERWYQKNAYYAGPLYPYALAVVRRVFGSPFLPARVLQMLLACCASAAVAAAVGRLGEEGRARAWAAVAAGVLYGGYGPLVFHDFFLYRDGPVAHLSTLLVALPLAAAGGGGAAAALGLGLLGGAATLMKQTVLPVALFSLYSLSKQAPGGRERGRSSVLLWGLLGVAIPLGVLAARNVAAGVPPLTFDTRQAIGLAWGNGFGADGTTNPPPDMEEILEEAGGSTSKTARLVLAGYREHPGALVSLMARKLATFFNVYEVPDNANFYFFRDRLAILKVLPVFPGLLGIGGVGLCAALSRRVLRRDEFALAAVGILAPLASCLLVQTTSRYRAGAIGPLAIGAGLFLFFLFEGIRQRAWRRVAILSVPAVLLSFVALLPSVIPDNRHRFSDTLVYATLVEAEEGPAAAANEVRRYLEEGDDDSRRVAGIGAVRYWAESGDRSTTLVEPAGIAPPDKRVRKKER
jgi:hypothetical protein